MCGVQINVKALAMKGHNLFECKKMRVKKRTFVRVLKGVHG